MRCKTRESCWLTRAPRCRVVLEELPREPSLPPCALVAPEAERRVYLDAWVAAPVYRFDGRRGVTRWRSARGLDPACFQSYADQARRPWFRKIKCRTARRRCRGSACGAFPATDASSG